MYFCDFFCFVEGGGNGMGVFLFFSNSLSSSIIPPPLHNQEILRIVGEVATGLGALHSEQMMHRDIKSQNVFMVEKIHCKLGFTHSPHPFSSPIPFHVR